MKFGDAVDVGGEELNCEKFVQLRKVKGKMSKNNGQRINSKISRKQISKYATEVQQGVLAVIKDLLAKVHSFTKSTTDGWADLSDNNDDDSQESDRLNWMT